MKFAAFKIGMYVTHFKALKVVAEVASIGGFVREYQIDVNPDALRAYDISISQVINAIKNSNVDVGARNYRS